MLDFPYKTTGRIQYDPPRGRMKSNRPGWCVLNMDREITRYYREVAKKRFHIELIPPSWDAHVSIFRGESHLVKHPDWKKYDGMDLEVTYSPFIKQTGDTTDDHSHRFFFIDVQSPFIKEMRDTMKVPSDWSFHLTIGKLPDNWDDYLYLKNDWK